MPAPLPDRTTRLLGRVFGCLTVLAYAGDSKDSVTFWLCACKCGAPNITVRGKDLLRGVTNSCGHLKIERCKRQFSTHGMSNSSEYKIWIGIKTRCLNPEATAYEHYGGRGITICDEWVDDFPAFIAHIGLRPSLKHSVERIRNGEGYKPGNVKWATQSEQLRNTRCSRILTIGGRSQVVAAWAEETGLPSQTIIGRLKLGWTAERAVSQPHRSQRATQGE